MNNRRDFIQKGAKVAVVASGLEALCRCAASSSNNNTTRTLTADQNNLLTLSFSNFPNLQTNNGSYVLTANLVSGTSRTIVVTRLTNTTAAAVLATCTHQGCTVGAFDGTAIHCPCHGSSFSATGAVLNAPAVIALTSYTATVTSSALTVQLS